MFADLGNVENVTDFFKAYFLVEAHSIDTSITPKKSSLIHFDNGEGHFEKGTGVALALVFGKSGHATEAVLVLIVNEIGMFFKIERGHAHKLGAIEGTEVKGEVIVILWKMRCLFWATFTKHFMTNVVGIRSADS